MNENVYVITFQSTHAAMAASKLAKSEGLTHYTIPTPREISAGCGMAMRFPASPQLTSQIWEKLLASGLTADDMTLHLALSESEYLPVEL